MLQKWKLIINNWINCYFDENSGEERVLKIECLLNIISHLRENFNLDESKSSILEAHTVEQFILEKYPDFKFENGTELASNEEDIYLAASLLLFFVCVTSKDVNMKSAMCNKLSRGDQEIILKFSKNLMECNSISYRDVQTAITDACGIHMATIDTGHVTVAETPPVLRSLHSEVRKLQAALDAERFDRNYLQDELSRTNLKLEKLVKDKEQYKIDIMNLKTKLSLCSSGDHVARGMESDSEQSAKLARQLGDLEEHLVRTQELLDDAVCERDDYKAKMQLLKQDRDKWMSLSQQESARAVQLAEDLETERRNMQSLRELVTDLRQHNKLNGLDISQLDCDESDASVQSFAHNMSVCSEVCANIIEVQLSEEKAKVVALQQQIEALQDYQSKAEKDLEERRKESIYLQKQIQTLQDKVESYAKDSAAKDEFIIKLNNEKDAVINNVNTELIAEKNLRERCQKDIEEKDTAISQLKHDLNNLNDEREALNIMLKENKALIKALEEREPPICDGSCATVIEVRAQLSEETAKVDALKQQIESLKSLQDEMANDKVKLASQCSILQDYKLNAKKQAEERQEEVVYLQNEIHVLQSKLEACEKESTAKNHLITKMNNEKDAIVNNANQELTAEKIIRERCEKYIEEKNITINRLTHDLDQLNDERETLKIKLKENEELIKSLEQREPPVCDGSCSKVIEVKVQLSEETAKVDALKQQIKSLQDEMSNDKITFASKWNILQDYKLKTEKELEERRQEVLYLQKEIRALQNNIESYEKDSAAKDDFITKMNNEKDAIISDVNEKLTTEKVLRESCQKDIEEKNTAINQLKHDLNQLNDEREAMKIKLKENEELIKSLEQREPPVCDGSCSKVIEVKVQLNEEIAKVDALKRQIESLQDEMNNNKITFAHKYDILQDYKLKTEKELEEKEQEVLYLQKEIHALKNNIESYEKDFATKDEFITKMNNEKDTIINDVNEKLTAEKVSRESCQKDMEEKNTVINQLKHDLDKLKDKGEALNKKLKENEELIKTLEQREPPVCDGSCTNVIEVRAQLIEETAKVDALKQQIVSLQVEMTNDNVKLITKCDVLQNSQLKSEKELEEKQIEISNLQKEIQDLQNKVESFETDSAAKDEYITKINNEKDEIINNVNKELAAEKFLRENCEKDLQEKDTAINELKLDLNKLNDEKQALNIMLKNNEELVKTLEQRELPICDGSCANVIAVRTTLNEETAKVDALRQRIESLQSLQDEMDNEKVTLASKCDTLQNHQFTAEKELEERQREIVCLQKEIQVLQTKIESCEKESAVKDGFVTQINNEKDAIIDNANKELTAEKILRERCEKDIVEKNITIDQLKHDLIQLSNEKEALNILKIENEELIKAFEHREGVICSNANDFEVQLSEEKAKVDALKQQIVSLQDYQLKVEKELDEGRKEILNLQKEIQVLQGKVDSSEKESSAKDEFISKMISEKDTIINNVNKELAAEKILRERYEKDIEEKNVAINQLKLDLSQLNNDSEALIVLKKENEELIKTIGQRETSVCSEAYVYDLEVQLSEERAKVDGLQQQIEVLKDKTANDKVTLISKSNTLEEIQKESMERQKEIEHLQNGIQVIQNKIKTYEKDYSAKELYLSEMIKEKDAIIDNVNKELTAEKNVRECYQKDIEEKNIVINQLQNDLNRLNNQREALNILKKENAELIKAFGQRETAVCSEAYAKLIEAQLTEERAKVDALEKQIISLQDELANDKVTLVSQCDILQDYQLKAEKEFEERQKENLYLHKEIEDLQSNIESYESNSAAKDNFIFKTIKDKEEIINNMNKELLAEKNLREKYQRDLEEKNTAIRQLKHDLIQLNNEREALNILKKENEELIKAIGQRETFAVRSQDNASSQKNSGQLSEKELRELHHQVDNNSDLYSSVESLKTISDLERIIHDKNRTITVLQTDITYLKNLMADSETKLLDVSKELEMSKENCHQLSNQLKKIVYQKNVEIADLKKQVNKMSVNETRASQIIKVSAKYQAIILKRMAEIKCNSVLKELTNYGNTNNSDDELRRSLNAGSITMEDLENFLETTERHIKKCSEKQSILQKERDRLAEVNRINESETINLKKFLTELSVSFQTFSSIKDLYAQKLSRVISVQRTVRREILNLDGRITDACMLKLERGYAAVMQDLSECIMNLERWVERCVGRTISSEKIKQAFMNDNEGNSLAPASIKNTGLEVQLDELENSFHKLLEEVSRAQKGEGAKEVQAVTVMEVRAEYEDKLNRMKAKMKQLYAEQIAVFKEKQKEEIAVLERELVRAREKLTQSSQRYEEHIRGLTSELWTVGEKFLRQKDEAEWLRRQQRSGSLMSLQHVRSAGLGPMEEEPGRPSDTHSLRSLPVNNNRSTNKRESRGLHMSDEEEELFDNRLLKELAVTPRRESVTSAPGQRLSVLQWRNSLCPPHLKSSYPAETQFVPALDEDEIKAMGTTGARQQRKEVGIIAYKKPGPPTPSKQAGRLSATDSELRESLRVEAGPQPSRKTSTPSRIRSLFRTSKNYTAELNETPRARRLSNIFRKKN